ncbi:MAG: zinc ribbon domain-containing protein [Gemmatimonadota bacterium]|nr:zinc ribbon domain-containing protein [Gemmatimonadota bacterium]HEU4988319.1 zinc ribbon domain-containing protein [Gemmatimonadaceae bacterium]
MDAIDRMFSVLARTVRDTQPRYLTQPFEVAELYQTLLPYRHFRRELALDTNEDYELTLMQLLSGARGYLIVDDRMRDALTRELQSPNPDPGAFREFADAQVGLSPAALQRQTLTPEGPIDATRGGASTVRLSTPASVAAAAAAVDETRCRYCSGKLPPGRSVVFCPHCGQNLTVMNCSACGAELEVGWKYCVACGRPFGQGA